MANKRIPELDPVVTAAQSDKFIVRQSGDVEDKHVDMDVMQLALLITESQITDLQSYLLVEVNDLSAAVVWADIPDANVPESAVTQHEGAIDHDALANFLASEHFTQAAISITESQISDLQAYLLAELNDLTAAVVWANIPDGNVPESAVTQHEAALAITESQIADGTILARVGAAETITNSWTFEGDITLDDGASLNASSGAPNEQFSLAQCDDISEIQFGSAVSRFDIGIGAPSVKTRLGTGFYLQERAAAGDDVTGYGQFWARTDDTPMFTTEGGTDIDLTASVAEINDLTAAVVWANVPDGNITESSVTQHEGAIDHDALANFLASEHFTQAAISITESQISDLGAYLENVVEDTSPSLGGDLDMNTQAITAGTATGPRIVDEAASGTNPTLIPRQNQLGTGIGAFSTNALSLIANSVEGFRVAESEGSVTNSFLGVLQGFANNSPQLRNIAASNIVPTLIPNKANATSGIGAFSANALSLIANGVEGIRLAESEGSVVSSFTGVLQGFNTAAPQLRNVAATATVPTVVPNRADADTGIGWSAAGIMSFIGNSLEIAQVKDHGGGMGVQLIIRPGGTQSAPLRPSLGFGDGDTGFFEGADDLFQVAIGGLAPFFWSGNKYGGAVAASGAILNETVSSTNPTIIPRGNDDDSGLGSSAADRPALIAGATTAVEYEEELGFIRHIDATKVGLLADGVQIQGQGALRASYNEIATVTVSGDAVTAPSVEQGLRFSVFNNGANDFQLFPASGDDIGAGVDTAIVVVVGAYASFLGRDATNWDTLFNSDPTAASLANIVEDTSPQLGGTLQANGNDIVMPDSDKIFFGTVGQFSIFNVSSVASLNSVANDVVSFEEVGVRKFSIDHFNNIVQVHDGYVLRISDADDTDFVDMSHAGAGGDFLSAFTNTVDWDITGLSGRVKQGAETLAFLSEIPSGGLVVNSSHVQTGAVATGTTTIPIDDTIPQITEGDEFMTLSHTPLDAANLLNITIGIYVESLSRMSVALFKDAVSDALGAVNHRGDDGDPKHIYFSVQVVAGTTSAITFRVRAGSTGGTTTFNGIGGGRIFGGLMASTITIEEITP